MARRKARNKSGVEVGKNAKGFAFYTYSNEKYELSVYPDGEFFGEPEDAFLVSANMYLSG
jgi:hypothetical protein